MLLGISVLLFNSALELLPEFGMGKLDESLLPLADGHAKEVDGTILGGDPMDVRAGGDDAGALLEEGDDAARLTAMRENKHIIPPRVQARHFFDGPPARFRGAEDPEADKHVS